MRALKIGMRRRTVGFVLLCGLAAGSAWSGSAGAGITSSSVTLSGGSTGTIIQPVGGNGGSGGSCNGIPCGNGCCQPSDPCHQPFCQLNTNCLQHPVCVDDDPCTEDSCTIVNNGPMCVHAPSSGLACDDNDVCTVN